MDRKTAAILVACGVGLIAAWGPLDPPEGPITSTYKTLTEIEPRIAVSAANTPGDADALFKITKPGSYHLTGNITGVSGKHGIEIAGPRVILDLCGFTLAGVGGAKSGISGSDAGSVVRNGTISGWSSGITIGTEARIEDIRSSDNALGGVFAGRSSVITRCVVRSNEGFGLTVDRSSVVTDCTSIYTTGVGFDIGPVSSIANCTAYSGTEAGFQLARGAAAQGCTADSNYGSGFVAAESATLTECTAIANEGAAGFQAIARSRLTRCIADVNWEEGFLLTEGNSAVECTSSNNGMAGFRIAGNANTVERCTSHENVGSGFYVSTGVGNNLDGNLATYNGSRGFYVFSSDNLIVRNRARGNTTANYTIDAGSDYGVILTNPGQGFTSSAAWANFAY